MKLANKKLEEKNLLTPQHLREHDYTTNEHLVFLLDQQYADDISWASTSASILETIEKEVPKALEERNLFVNESKTEKYTVSNDPTKTDWKDCKLVGSKLDTERDIKNRKKIASASYNKLKSIFKEKSCSVDAKLAIFTALVENIFLYNSEIRTLTKALENEINVFQRRLLRNLMNFRWTEDRKHWPETDRLYEFAKQVPWSVKIKQRRLSFLVTCVGYLMTPLLK